jgi:hypothetical protein
LRMGGYKGEKKKGYHTFRSNLYLVNKLLHVNVCRFDYFYIFTVQN